MRVHQDNSAVQGPSNDNTNSNDESSSDSSLLENDDDSDEPGQVQTNATSKTPDTEVWEKIETSQNNSRKLNFDFKPAKFPGLEVDLNSDSTPLHCFFELFTDEVEDALTQFINSFAENKCQHSKDTCSKDSLFASWKPINRYELMKFIAVVVAMGLDKRAWMRNY